MSKDHVCKLFFSPYKQIKNFFRSSVENHQTFFHKFSDSADGSSGIESREIGGVLGYFNLHYVFFQTSTQQASHPAGLRFQGLARRFSKQV